jgi:hemerythrin
LQPLQVHHLKGIHQSLMAVQTCSQKNTVSYKEDGNSLKIHPKQYVTQRITKKDSIILNQIKRKTQAITYYFRCR